MDIKDYFSNHELIKILVNRYLHFDSLSFGYLMQEQKEWTRMLTAYSKANLYLLLKEQILLLIQPEPPAIS